MISVRSIILPCFLLLLPISACTGSASVPSTEEPESASEIVYMEESEPDIESTSAASHLHIGESFYDEDLKITLISTGIYDSSEHPEEGMEYRYMSFAFENQSTADSYAISFYNFQGYADNYPADPYYSASEELSAMLTPGRMTTGTLIFIVPEDTENFEVEYISECSGLQPMFLYDSPADSGYSLPRSLIAAENSHPLQSTVSFRGLKMTFTEFAAVESENTYLEAPEGYRYASFYFDIENNNSEAAYIASYDFDCYADGILCRQVYFPEDDLNYELQAGRRGLGSVTFEIPLDAAVIECEYASDYRRTDRVIFSASN